MADAHDLSGLMEFATGPRWRDHLQDALSDHFGPAMAEFEVDFDKLPDIVGNHWSGILWGCAFEDLLTRAVGPRGRTIVEDYLKGRGPSEGRANAAYMRALAASVLSLHEVSDVRPGQSMLLRDLVLGGEPVRVTEHSATRTLRNWDVIAARVVELDDGPVISGGTLSFTPEATRMLLDGLRRAVSGADGDDGYEGANPFAAGGFGQASRGNGKRFELRGMHADVPGVDADVPDADGSGADGIAINADILRPLACLVTSAWLFNVVPKAMGLVAPPTLRNADGEEVVFHRVRFPFRRGTTQAVIAERLDALTALDRAGPKFWNWLDDGSRGAVRQGASNNGAPSERALQWNVTMDDGSVVLGNVELKGRALILSVASAGRAERGAMLLADALGDLVGTPLTEIETVEQAMAARGEHDAGSRSAASASSEPEVPPEVEAALVRDMLDRHYRAVLDQPIEMLGDVTPREAVRTRPGRKRAAAWLKQLENGTGRINPNDPMASYDLAWMWRELGIKRLRK